MSENKIKKSVIREDLLSITKDYRKAILLNQFIYWSERVSDADKFIEKENEIAKNNGEVERELFYGWIYKTAEELAYEVMLGLSASQIRRYINDLVDLGYLLKRNNPKYKWDRTLQYRVNLVNIAKDLKKNGFPLSDYKIDIPDDENTITHQCVINDEPDENQSQSGERAIPENTNRNYNAENTNKNALSGERASESDSDKTKKQSLKKEANELFERVWKLYPKKLGKGQVSDTQKLKLLKIGYDELERAVNRCCQYNKDRDMRYWQNGSTFFNSGYVDFLDDNFNGNNEINKKEQQESASGMEIEDNELDSGEKFQTIDQPELEDEIIFAAHSFSDKCSSLCLVNKIKDFMFCFIEKYAQKTGKSHPMVYPDMLGRIMYIVTNKIVVNGITYKPLVTEDVNDESYKKIIDKYFEKNKKNFTLEDFCDKNKIYEMMSAVDWSVII